MLLRVIDIETTGQTPPAEIVEFGRVDVEHDAASTTIRKQQSRLYRPLHGIPVETMAVHHLTPALIPHDAPVCTPERLRRAVWGGTTPNVLIAHNADFERLFITQDASGRLALDLHLPCRPASLAGRAAAQQPGPSLLEAP